jgi:hypothetical protein
MRVSFCKVSKRHWYFADSTVSKAAPTAFANWMTAFKDSPMFSVDGNVNVCIFCVVQDLHASCFARDAKKGCRRGAEVWTCH